MTTSISIQFSLAFLKQFYNDNEDDFSQQIISIPFDWRYTFKKNTSKKKVYGNRDWRENEIKMKWSR